MSSSAARSPLPLLVRPHVEAMTDCLESWRPGQPGFHARLDAVLRDAWMDLSNPVLAAEWRSPLLSWFEQAPFIHRAYRKPLGYAGDYELMNLIYRNAPEGKTPVGRALHQWANSFRSAAAVRSRRRTVLQEMQDHALRTTGDRYRILSLASGPATELQDLVRESFLADRADLRCVDQDRRSLAHARSELDRAMLEAGRQVPASFSGRSVKQLLAEGGEREEGGPRDFVYAMGLYDYLPERVARRLVTLLYGLLAPGGRLVIGNYSRDADAQPFLDLVCDWHLIYRSADEVRALGSELPGDARVEVRLDSTRCVWFLVVDRP